MSDNRKHASKSASARTPKAHDWMAPVDPAAPCGADLEYDPEFVVLSAKVAPRAEAQYGDFVGSPEPVNWSDVDRDCRRLMMRSKDMRLAVLFTRCRTRLAGAAGLAEGAGLLAVWLATFPDAIHPQPDVDADRDAALEIRKNALQALTDADGLLADVREIALTRSTAIRLQVRDVERAFAQPRPGDALAPESVVRQLDELQAQQPAVLAGFDEALASVDAIDAWSREHLGAYAPDLSALVALLRPVAGRSVRSGGADSAAAPADVSADAPSMRKGGRTRADESPPAHGEGAAALIAGSVGRGAIATPADRHAARELIRQAREWFEQHEPSSPIPVLLRRAEYFVGKRYAEVVHAIPGELLAQWGGDES
ncbi:type VI secretion system ImpA family N-terminal domain-containing protein [Burkholderia oklahomensis]|uniref:type VI secretion system protein TssA n=1 Tax=Burkholderia oklahomensis TaxID=342113 RepID=UPI002653F675|nr:type VI secretion system ImpA family N-terminal domain-containing protein [Burkholderia oklahomensis]MDN7672083.1 type VI secretion system ImpA family N-terminal domain-containing protein [Burkholderia oklahomensis]